MRITEDFVTKYAVFVVVFIIGILALLTGALRFFVA